MAVYSWDRGDFGQLGLRDETNRNCPSLIHSVVEKDILHVEAGDFHTAFLTGDGELYTTGSNECGQLGAKMRELQLSPIRVAALDTYTISHVACGQSHTVAVTGGAGSFSLEGGTTMETKKKREKASSNGAPRVETEAGSVQQNSVLPTTYKAIRPAAPVDLLKRQREVKQQGGPAKKVLLSGPAAPVLPFSPTQHYPLVGHWQYPPTQQPPPFVPPAQPQPPVSQGQPLQRPVQPPQSQQQTQQQQGITQAAPQQGQGQAQAGQSPSPYWGGSEFPPPSSAGQYYPFPGGSTDPNWQCPTYPSAPSVPNTLPYGYPGPYAYPAAVGQTGYTGTWPDQSWWAGNPAQQPSVFPGGYGPPYQSYGPAYGYVPPPGATGAPPLPFQRGYIKAPPGLSQKHQRLWETQSCENIHLWSSLARAEAELGALRNKVLHLEGELHALSGHQDVRVRGDAVNVPAGLQQPTKKGRHKKSLGSINSDLGATKRGRKLAVDKTVTEGTVKSDDKSDEKEGDIEDKNLGTPGKDVRKEKTKLVADTDGNKELFGDTPVRNVFEPDICAAETSHTLDGESKTLVYGDPCRSTYHTGCGLSNGVNGEAHAVEKTGSMVNMASNSPGYAVKMAGHSDEPAENNCHSDITPGAVGEDWTAGDDRNCSFEDRLLYDSGALVRSDRKVIQEWGEYGGEDVSDDHEADELVPSGQDDEEDIDDDDDSGLRSIAGTKVHNLVVGLGSGKGIPPLSGW